MSDDLDQAKVFYIDVSGKFTSSGLRSVLVIFMGLIWFTMLGLRSF
jgi:hypothetical protein